MLMVNQLVGFGCGGLTLGGDATRFFTVLGGDLTGIIDGQGVDVGFFSSRQPRRRVVATAGTADAVSAAG